MSPSGHGDSAFKQAVVLACCDALQSVGFTRYRKHHVDWPIAQGVHCWVGLDAGLRKGHVDINPFVGIHVVPIMKRHAAIARRKYSRSDATFAVHMGALVPRELSFRFSRHTDLQSEANRLARLYLYVGACRLPGPSAPRERPCP